MYLKYFGIKILSGREVPMKETEIQKKSLGNGLFSLIKISLLKH
jgi:hypothetical protein